MPTVSGFSVDLADRVRETTSTTGTGTYSLNGAVTGFQSFVSGIGSGDRALYTALLGTSWEVGIGTVTSGAPATLTRDVILAGSNGTSPVNWGGGTKDIFTTAAAALMSQIYATPFASIKVTTFTSSGTFTTDAKCLYARVRAVGGGGGGGGTAATSTGESAEGSGGGGGEYAEGIFTAAQLGASKTVTIGAGGTFNTGTGGAGGTTSLGTLLTAGGGSGGAFGVASSTDSTAASGAGGSGGTGGSLHIAGSPGGRGVVRNGDGTLNGFGGAAGLGYGGSVQQVINDPGTTGQTYGGGGAGASTSPNTATRNSGAGASGIIIVEEYLKP